MFTGIIETVAEIVDIATEGDNVHFKVACALSGELKIDQSVSHNGVCLTVVACDADTHTVTAVRETLIRTNLGDWQVGTRVNIERAMLSQARIDGHWVQGHVDTRGEVVEIRDDNGSWQFTFSFPEENRHLLVDKGSVCINGTSLTVVSPVENRFSVAIIPYTYAHTTFGYLKVGDAVNLEFDIIGKYIANYAKLYFKN
jgi:riboflavin synthase